MTKLTILLALVAMNGGARLVLILFSGDGGTFDGFLSFVSGGLCALMLVPPYAVYADTTEESQP